MIKKSNIQHSTFNIHPIYDVCIIGGGPAGLMAAGIAGKGGAKVLLIEKNEELGKKLLMTGGGRCNITNLEPDKQKFMSNFGKKKDFLYTPFSVFDSEDTVRFFNSLNIKTKVEENFRVFPESDNSLDILESLIRFARNNNVEFKLGAEVAGFDFSPPSTERSTCLHGNDPSQIKNQFDGAGRQESRSIKSVLLKDGTMISAKSFILTSGGKSHPETGSTGDGFVWLKKIGHKVIDSNPALVPIKTKEKWVSDLAGVSLQDVGISVWSLDHSLDKQSEELRSDLNFQKVFKRQGKVLFTHEGLSGPAILNMSKDVGELLSYGNEVKISLDFFSGIGLDVIQEKFKKIFEDNKNKKVKNLVFKEVSAKIFEKVLELTGVDGDWNINQIMKEERVMILEKLRKFDFTVEKLLGFDKSIVSSGGLDLKEVDFKTMQSKLYENLYFAGDILDFDRQSGGFSLQLCWTTGYVAGKSAGNSL
jgi:predicted Rossmann fold flavoprotein